MQILILNSRKLLIIHPREQTSIFRLKIPVSQLLEILVLFLILEWTRIARGSIEFRDARNTMSHQAVKVEGSSRTAIVVRIRGMRGLTIGSPLQRPDNTVRGEAMALRPPRNSMELPFARVPEFLTRWIRASETSRFSEKRENVFLMEAVLS